MYLMKMCKHSKGETWFPTALGYKHMPYISLKETGMGTWPLPAQIFDHLLLTQYHLLSVPQEENLLFPLLGRVIVCEHLSLAC